VTPLTRGGISGTGYTANQKPNRVLQDCRHGGPSFNWYNLMRLPWTIISLELEIAVWVRALGGNCQYRFLGVQELQDFGQVGLQFLGFYNLFNKTQFRADQTTSGWHPLQ
jgi:hypothetical protein